MRKIVNPYANLKGYNCFGCSPENPYGLKMTFEEDGDEVICHWKPEGNYQGWHNTLHGGIQAALMDETASWAVSAKLGVDGVTSRMTSRFRKAISTLDHLLTIKARVKELKRNIAFIDVKIFNSNNEVCAESEVQFFTYPPEIARQKLC